MRPATRPSPDEPGLPRDVLLEMLDLLPHGVVVWRAETDDPADLRLTYSNARTEQESGFDARQLVGTRMADSLPAALEFWGPAFMRVIRSGQATIEEAPFGDDRHPYRFHRVHIIPCGPTSVLVVNENITEVKEARARLLQVNAELQRFAGAVAHDLKHPISTILGFSQILGAEGGESAGPNTGRIAERIVSNAKLAAAMIDDLLDYARHTGPPGERSPVSTEDIVAWVRGVLSQQITAEGATVAHGDLPVVMGNASALRQVFLNVIANALKYRRRDVAPNIRLTAEERGDGFATIAVTDNGIGIDPAHREAVFELGIRIRSDDTLGTEGSGIGLSSCRVVVEHHGGAIWAEASPEEPGTTIKISLPLAEAAIEETTPLSPSTRLPRGVRVMLVEDDPDMREILRLSAEAAGITMAGEAADGQRGIEAYRQMNEPPSVVVIDYKLPGMDGIEVAHRIRSLRPDQPIVLYSSHLNEELVRRAEAAGVAACVRKQPPTDIARVILSVLSVA